MEKALVYDNRVDISNRPMAIKRVIIENYRSIRSLEFTPGPLCVLVGENNAGKSNILQALKKVLLPDWVSVKVFSEEDRRDKDPENDILIEIDFDPPLIHKPFVHWEDISIPIVRFVYTRYKKGTADAQAGDPRLVVSCLTTKAGPVFVPQEAPRKGVQPKMGPLTTLPRDVRDQLRLIHIGTDRSLAQQLPSTRYSLLRRLLEDVDDALRRRPEPVEGEDAGEGRTAYETFIGHLKRALEVLRIPELEELERLLRRYALENLGYDPVRDEEKLKFEFSLFDSVDFLKALRLVFSEHGRTYDATELGEGAQNALVIAIFQAYEKLRKSGAIFLIEEPEMFLHPHRQRYFYQTLRKLAESNQVIYTTHSPHFVAIPQYEEVHVVFRGKDGYTEIRKSTLSPTAALREKLRKEFDPERNELFFARRIILVEGDTEKLALPEYARRMSVDLDNLGCSIVEAGGKKNLLPMAEVIMSFGLSLTLVFDRDSSDFQNQSEEEQTYNEQLRQLKTQGVDLVELSPDYEAALRQDLGEEEYQKLCASFPGRSKAVRHRLIAADESVPVPEFVQNILGFGT